MCHDQYTRVIPTGGRTGVVRPTPAHSPNSAYLEHFYHMISAISRNMSLFCFVEQYKCTSMSQGVITYLRVSSADLHIVTLNNCHFASLFVAIITTAVKQTLSRRFFCSYRRQYDVF